MTVNVLLSYAFHKKTNLNQVRDRLGTGRLLIDSGAFTAHSTGKQISLDEYAEYLQTFQDAWDYAITLDVIGDPKASQRQTRKLHSKGIPVLPVFTRGESIKEFDAMVKDVGYVAVGGGGGMNVQAGTKRMALLQQRARDLGGGIHALGVGSYSGVKAIRPFSADSANVDNAFIFGTIQVWTGTRLLRVPVSDRDKLIAARPHFRKSGISIAESLRTKRLPKGEGRDQLMRGMTLSYAASGEMLRRLSQTPPPDSINDVPGTHLYSAVVATIDGTLHAAEDVTNGTTAPVYHQWAEEARNTSRPTRK